MSSRLSLSQGQMEQNVLYFTKLDSDNTGTVPVSLIKPLLENCLKRRFTRKFYEGYIIRFLLELGKNPDTSDFITFEDFTILFNKAITSGALPTEEEYLKEQKQNRPLLNNEDILAAKKVFFKYDEVGNGCIALGVLGQALKETHEAAKRNIGAGVLDKVVMMQTQRYGGSNRLDFDDFLKVYESIFSNAEEHVSTTTSALIGGGGGFATSLENARSKCGYLSKEGAKVKNWKKRWFKVHDDQCLSYYKQRGDTKALNTIELKGASVSGESEKQCKERPFMLQLHTASRTFYFAAATEIERNDWVAALQMLIYNAK